VADTNVNPLDRTYSGEVRRYRHDPATASRLLDEAGWSKLVNGVRVDAAGQPLQLEIMTTSGDRARELVQQVLHSQWKQLGIDVRIRNQPARVFFGDTVSRRRFSAMAMFAWISGPESVPRTTLHSKEVPTAENGWAGQNYGGYRNAEVDALIEAIEVELDESKRRLLWHRLQAIYADELPALPLLFGANAFVVPPWLQGVVPTGHQYPSTLWVEGWSVVD
jgi:peptide/nickel transport system substrate-binding protein